MRALFVDPRKIPRSMTVTHRFFLVFFPNIAKARISLFREEKDPRTESEGTDRNK